MIAPVGVTTGTEMIERTWSAFSAPMRSAVRTPDGRVDDFTSPGQMLGLRPGGERATKTLPAPPGTVLVFYTDGLTEATRDTDEGQRRLHEVMARDDVVHGARPARAIVQQVLRATEASDDIAVLVVRVG